jgi:hypothetical protein
MRTLLVLAGLGQIALSLGSLAIPRALGWIEDTAKLRPLTRQVFWTYATYIWATNVCFGLISSVAPDLFLDRSSLARLVCGFIATYWGARVIVQFVLFGRSEAPPGLFFKIAEAALVVLFVYLTAVYGYVAIT